MDGTDAEARCQIESGRLVAAFGPEKAPVPLLLPKTGGNRSDAAAPASSWTVKTKPPGTETSWGIAIPVSRRTATAGASVAKT
ncbi:MAG: hypothetical protein LBQ12_01615 [Deltaproteobacteria bacterium]|jgi:hypothetical protein|nr:hypothetical protein [Deltaproteobacteria bacterium]